MERKVESKLHSLRAIAIEQPGVEERRAIGIHAQHPAHPGPRRAEVLRPASNKATRSRFMPRAPRSWFKRSKINCAFSPCETFTLVSS